MNKQTTEEAVMETGWKSWQIWALMLGLLFAAIIFLYQEPVIKGEKLAIADVKAQGIIFEKNRADYHQEFKEHPQWYPYIFAGMPFHASGTYRLRYTLETLYNILPRSVRSALTVSFTFNLFFGGLFMILLLRSYGLSYLAAFTGAMAFIFSTKMLGTPHTNRIVTFIHLPLILYSLRMAVTSRKWIYFVLLGGAVGSQIGSYHPQVAFYGLMLIGLYTLYRFILSVREKEPWLQMAQFAGLWVLALGVGYLMASIVLMPMQEYLPYSIRGAAGQGTGGEAGLSFAYATSWSFGWDELGQFIIPSFNGHSGNAYWGDSPHTTYPHYLGIMVVILAVLGAAWNRNRKDYWFHIIFIVITILMAMGKNFESLSRFLLANLPYFNKFREPSMILILTILSISVLAGWGAESVFRRIREEKDENLVALFQKLLIGTGVVLVLAVLFKSGLQGFMEGIYQDADIARGRMRRYANMAQAQAFNQVRFDMFFRDLMLTCMWALVSLGLLWAAFSERLRIKTALIAIPLILFVDLAIQGRMVIPEMFAKSTRQQLTPTETDAVRFLMADDELFRVYPLDQPTTNDYAWFNISSIGGYHAAKMAKYQEIIDANLLSNGNFLKMANTKYLISQQAINHPALSQVFSKDGTNIYRFQNYSPRAFVVGDYVVTSTKEETFDLMRTMDVNPDSTVILHEAVEPIRGGSGDVTITNWEPQKYEMDVRIEGEGYLVISEVWYPPGWHATVDGEPVPILRANHTFQAIKLGDGDHKVVIDFSAKTFSRGLALSRGLFYLILIALIGHALYVNRSTLKERFSKK